MRCDFLCAPHNILNRSQSPLNNQRAPQIAPASTTNKPMNNDTKNLLRTFFIGKADPPTSITYFCCPATNGTVTIKRSLLLTCSMRFLFKVSGCGPEGCLGP